MSTEKNNLKASNCSIRRLKGADTVDELYHEVVRLLDERGFLSKENKERHLASKDIFHEILPIFVTEENMELALSLLDTKTRKDLERRAAKCLISVGSFDTFQKRTIYEWLIVRQILLKLPKLKECDGFSEKSHGYLYRGEDSIYYSPIPSILRGVDTEGILDFDWLKRQCSGKVYNSFKDVFNHIKNERVEDKIDFYEMAQHALGKSPFLDFTRDIRVAYSMASHYLVGTNPNGDSLCRIISVKRDNATPCKNPSFKKEIHRLRIKNCKRFDPFSCDKEFDDKRRPEKFSDVIDVFKPDIKLFEKRANDRMKCQKGCFLFFRKALLINNRMSFQNSNSFSIWKVPKKILYQKLESLENSLRYDYGLLMNPYDLFVQQSNIKNINRAIIHVRRIENGEVSDTVSEVREVPRGVDLSVCVEADSV